MQATVEMDDLDSDLEELLGALLNHGLLQHNTTDSPNTTPGLSLSPQSSSNS